MCGPPPVRGGCACMWGACGADGTRGGAAASVTAVSTVCAGGSACGGALAVAAAGALSALSAVAPLALAECGPESRPGRLTQAAVGKLLAADVGSAVRRAHPG